MNELIYYHALVIKLNKYITLKGYELFSAGDHVKIYQSENLINWKYVSDFGVGQGSHAGTWECPDLFELAVDGDPNNKKWVLAASISEGAPAGGSGMQYFVGDFDGTTFTNENEPEKVLWADYGSDFYAAVTWSDIPREDGRRLWLGWMNNWLYGQNLPTTEFRGAMSLPRELALTNTSENGVRLIQKPVREFESLRENKKRWENEKIGINNDLLSSMEGKQFEIIAEFDRASATATEFGFTVRKGEKSGTKIGYNINEQQLFVDRTRVRSNRF